MRHVLGLAPARNSFSRHKHTFSLDQPALLTLENLPTSPSLSIERKFKKELNPAIKRKWQILGPGPSPGKRNFGRREKMHSFVQFITTPTSDTPGTALLLHFDDKRYIVGNAHEGLQRASIQAGSRIFKSKDIILTGRTEWQSNGGLLGMILNLADAAAASAQSKAEMARLKLKNKNKREQQEKDEQRKKKNRDAKRGPNPSEIRAPTLPRTENKEEDPTPTPPTTQDMEEDPTVRLHGGPNLRHVLAAARGFIFRKGTPIEVLEHCEEQEVADNAERDWKPTWSDHRIQVWAMPIEPSTVSEVSDGPKLDPSLKPNLDELMTGERPSNKEILDMWSVHSMSQEDQEKRNRETRELAVSEMFSSAWSHGDLVERPLREIKMPAVLFVRDPETKDLTRYEGPTPDGIAPVPDIKVLFRPASPASLIDHLPPTKRSSTAMSYIIRNHRQRGKFRTDAAQERNVPPGPLWTALASGSSVQSSDGVTITPAMVLEPSKDGNGVAVIDLPSSEYVHGLVHRPEWMSAKVMSGVCAVIWILGADVARDETLIRFIESQPGIQHIISSPERCPNYLSMTSAACTAVRHNQIDPARYAIPVHSNALPTSGKPATLGEGSSQTLFKSCPPASRGLKLTLEPTFNVEEDEVVPPLSTAIVVQETPESVLKLSQAARREIGSPAAQAEKLNQNLPSPDAEIICLGTGSASPSQHRNVSATLLRVPGCGSYLMDCGENTLGQLKRMYTAPQLAEVLQDLKLVWISHMHADHHLGMISVIKAWYEEVHGKDEVKRRRPTMTEQMLEPAKLLDDGKRLFIVGHKYMMRWMEEYSYVEDFGYDQLVPLVSFPITERASDICRLEWNRINVGFNASRDPKIQSAIRRATGLSDLVSCVVSHCHGAQAVSLTFPTGFKFSYSGDCRPSNLFAEIGRHSTVLLHEATFYDELQSEAIAKKHSTTSEAIGVGVAMGARRVILTHFSQRYRNIPTMGALDTRSFELDDAKDFNDPSAGMDHPAEESTGAANPQATMDKILDGLDEKPSLAQTINSLAQTIASNINPTPRSQTYDMKIGVAFDYMRVKVGDIIDLEKFTPALQELYKKYLDGAKETWSEKEALSNDKNAVLKKEQAKKVESEDAKGREGGEGEKGSVQGYEKKQENGEKQDGGKGKRKRDEKSTSAGEAMDGVEMKEPAVEKTRAVY